MDHSGQCWTIELSRAGGRRPGWHEPQVAEVEGPASAGECGDGTGFLGYAWALGQQGARIGECAYPARVLKRPRGQSLMAASPGDGLARDVRGRLLSVQKATPKAVESASKVHTMYRPCYTVFSTVRSRMKLKSQ